MTTTQAGETVTLDITPYTGYGYGLDSIWVYRTGSPHITVPLYSTGAPLQRQH